MIFAVFVGMVLAAVLVIIIMIAVARGPILYVAWPFLSIRWSMTELRKRRGSRSWRPVKSPLTFSECRAEAQTKPKR